MKKRLLCLLLMWLLVLPMCASALETTVAGIQKYGNLILAVSAADFLKEGYTYGDVVTVAINGCAYDMPVGTSYSDVDEGSMICRLVAEDDAVVLAINMGDLATHSRIAVKTKIEAEPGYRWDYTGEKPVCVTFAMKEAAGYLNEFLLRHLVRTNERADYAHLGDEQFANFRAVSATDMGKHVLYRSSSPINPELNRSQYADRALSMAGVRTIINLADTQDGMRAYVGFDQSAYANCNVIALNLGVDFMAADFQAGLADGLRFMMQHEGPYLVHCTEGKDRAGFVSALLSCLMGADASEVFSDYMVTYFNYYGVEPGSERYREIAERNIGKTLEQAFGVEDIAEADLAAEAEAYLAETLALSAAEISLLKAKLAGEQ